VSFAHTHSAKLNPYNQKLCFVIGNIHAVDTCSRARAQGQRLHALVRVRNSSAAAVEG